MSSTNRGGLREASDYYVTPVPAIVDFLMEFWGDNPKLSFEGKFILDPCAGGDDKHGMSYPAAINKWDWEGKPPSILTNDIRVDSLAETKTDWLSYPPIKEFAQPDVIITNPPFALAQEITEKALKDVKSGGLVIMLLRLNFLGGQKRVKFWETHMPTWIYIHSKRMSFTDDKKTDSIEYMHAVWIAGESPKFAKVRVI